MKKSTKIIEDGFIFTGDKQKRAGKLNLLIQDGRIADIGKSAEVLKALHPSAEVIHAENKIILPGFIDAHHSGVSFMMRYMTSGQPMSRWNKNSDICAAFEFLQHRATYEDFLALYRLSYYAALKSGITSLAEFGFDTPEHSFMAAVEAMRQSNIRGSIGLHNSDQIEAAKNQHESAIRFGCAVTDEEELTTYNFQSTVRTAHNLQWPLLLHIGQTRRGFDIVKKNFNKSIVQLYADYQVFEHPVHVSRLACFHEGDVEILEKHGVVLVLSPAAILQKETDLPPFEKLLKHKIPLAFGSDWGAAQPLENLQTYSLLLKVLDLPGNQANDLLALHTKNGARALGLDAETGSIEIGKRADIIFLNLSEFTMNPILTDENTERVLGNVLIEAKSRMISDVIIHGEFYIREGHLLTYSEEDLAHEGRTLLKKMRQEALHKDSVPSASAAILPFPKTHKAEKEMTPENLPLEEGFRIIRKDSVPSAPQGMTNVSVEPAEKASKNIRKIFGEDDI